MSSSTKDSNNSDVYRTQKKTFWEYLDDFGTIPDLYLDEYDEHTTYVGTPPQIIKHFILIPVQKNTKNTK